MTDDPSPTIHDPFPNASPSAGVGSAPALEPVRPLSPAPAPKKGSAGLLLNLLLIVAAAVAIGGVAFALGRSTAPVSAAAGNRVGLGTGQFGAGRSFDPNASFPAGAGQGVGGFGGRGGNLGISGTVETVSPTSITIKTANGQEVTFSLSDTTTYHAATAAAASDVTTGATVTVRLGAIAGGALGQPGASGAPALTATDVTVGK